MDKEPQSRFVFPNAEHWAELCHELKLSDAQADALRATLREVENLCTELDAELGKSEVKRSLKVVDRLLSNAHRGLQRKDIRQALATIEMRGSLSALLSPEAGTAIHGNNRVDALAHDQMLNQRTAEVMTYLLQELRRPIAEWLAAATQDKGGNKPKSHRQAMILLLACDANNIIGSGPSSTRNGPFHLLCSWVSLRCGIDDQGLEDAITRCLKKYKTWLEWAQLPSAANIVGQLSAEQIAAIPDDLEEELAS